MKKLALVITLLAGLASQAQALDPVSPPPLVEAPWTRRGDPVPAGYRVRTEPNWGLVSAGAATLAITYGPFVLVAIQSGQAFNAIPIVGTILAYRPSEETWIGNFIDALAMTALVVDGLMQAGGVVMLVAGLAARKSSLERIPTSRPGLEVLPAAPGSSLGLSVRGRF